MVGTIAPVVYRLAPDGKKCWLISATIYTLGSVIGGSIVGACLGSLGAFVILAISVERGFAPLLLAGAAIAYALHELSLVSLPYPERRRQVPSEWRYRFHPYVTAGLFGLLLGAGFTTFIPSASYYILGLAVTLQGAPLLGSLVFAIYGGARASLLWLFSQNATTFDTIARLTQYMDATKHIMRQVNGFALAMAGAYLVATVLLSH